MRGYKPYSPDDERFELIFKDMRTEEAYADMAFPGDPDPVVYEQPAEVETETGEEAVEAPETAWEDVTEDFHIEDVVVAETPAQSVSADVMQTDDATDGTDEGFVDLDRAEIDLELHETVAEEPVVPDEDTETEADFNEPAWEEDETGSVVNTADEDSVDTDESTADDDVVTDENIENNPDYEDDTDLAELVRHRLANDHSMPLETLIKELGFEDEISLEEKLEVDVDDPLDDDDEETSMELDLSFVDDEDDEK